MTLLIACLLIYHYDMAWYWYAGATVLWWVQTYISIKLLDEAAREAARRFYKSD